MSYNDSIFLYFLNRRYGYNCEKWRDLKEAILKPSDDSQWNTSKGVGAKPREDKIYRSEQEKYRKYDERDRDRKKIQV